MEYLKFSTYHRILNQFEPVQHYFLDDKQMNKNDYIFNKMYKHGAIK